MKWTNEQEPTKPCELKPMHWEADLRARYTLFTKRFLLLLLSVSLITVLSGCSKAVSVQPMPTPPANLEAPCHNLPMPPEPLLDPARAIWEIEVLTAYGDCAGKHRLAIEAWRNAVETANNT